MVHSRRCASAALTEGSGALLGKTTAELKEVKFKDTPERMMTLRRSLRAGRRAACRW